MAISKVVYGNQTLIDLTSDTVDADSLTQGITAHDKSGETITGKLIVGYNLTVSSTPPTSSDGNDGDLWLVI